jgi:hypothetical protein
MRSPLCAEKQPPAPPSRPGGLESTWPAGLRAKWRGQEAARWVSKFQASGARAVGHQLLQTYVAKRPAAPRHEMSASVLCHCERPPVSGCCRLAKPPDPVQSRLVMLLTNNIVGSHGARGSLSGFPRFLGRWSPPPAPRLPYPASPLEYIISGACSTGRPADLSNGSCPCCCSAATCALTCASRASQSLSS